MIARGQAMVTGGAGDIGRAISTALATAGFAVTALDTREAQAGMDRDGVRFARADTTSPEEMRRAVDALPTLDVAVLCAGTVTAQPFLEIDPDVWRRQLEINLTGAFIAAQVAARRMVGEGIRGHLIFISSWVAERPWPEIASYSASKAGLNQLMRVAALELSPHGIRANAVAPGIVLAGLAKGQLQNEPQYAARASRAIPLGAPQTAEQIADAVAFLASPGAATMTGSVLTVDSGCTLGTLG